MMMMKKKKRKKKKKKDEEERIKLVEIRIERRGSVLSNLCIASSWFKPHNEGSLRCYSISNEYRLQLLYIPILQFQDKGT